MDYVINEMNDLKEKLADIDEKEGSLGMRPGDEMCGSSGRETCRDKKEKKWICYGNVGVSAVGIIALILSAIMADSVVVSIVVAVIAAMLVGFCGNSR